jgi:hypothetical protein
MKYIRSDLRSRLEGAMSVVSVTLKAPYALRTEEISKNVY